MERRKLLVLFSGFFAMATVLVFFSSVGFAQSVSISVSTTQKIHVSGDGPDFWFCVELDQNGQLKTIGRSEDSCKTVHDQRTIDELQNKDAIFDKTIKGRGVKNFVPSLFNSVVVSVEGNTTYYCSGSGVYP